MQPQNHSDTTLLIWADWLEENNEEQKAHDLREEIAHPPADHRWTGDHFRYSGGSTVAGSVFGAYVGDHNIGGVACCSDPGVGSIDNIVGGGHSGRCVGGG